MMALSFIPPEDNEYPRWVTDTQIKYLEAVKEHGGQNAAARALGVAKSSVNEAIATYRKEAARRGHAPGHFDSGAAPGFTVGKVTIQRAADGSVERTWERQSPDAQAQDLIREGVAAFMETPIVVPVFSCPDPSYDVVPWIQIGDAHIGMLAHEAEAGADFNVQIAEREMCAAFRLLIDQIEPCERIVVNDLGDRDHIENTEKLTARSRVPLDAGRPRLMIRTSSKVMRFVIDLALTKARNVDVIINQGNHSRFGDLYMNELLTVAYAESGRVNVIDNESVFIGYRMGKTLVMTHHSDRCPVDRLAGVMMSDFKQDFAETDFHYIDIGHIHHKTAVKERDGIVIESWNTLARGDKWHKESGYRARQSMSLVFRSRTYGDIGRRTVPIQMVYDAIRRGHDAEGVSFIPQERRAFAA
jgi:hypothetical protein